MLLVSDLTRLGHATNAIQEAKWDALAQSILAGTGSVGVSFIYWTLGYLVSILCIPFPYPLPDKNAAMPRLWRRIPRVHSLLPQSLWV
jgi:hypothetical protein